MPLCENPQPWTNSSEGCPRGGPAVARLTCSPNPGETGQYLHAPGSSFKGIFAFSTQHKVRKTGELNPN